MAFLEKTLAVGTTDTELYVCPTTLSGSAHGLTFSNITGVARAIILKLFSQATGLTTQVTSSGQVIPANGQFTWPKPINMVAGDKIIASADTVSSVVAVIAVYLDQAAMPSSAFTPQGTWSAIANYVVNDVVVAADGTSYLAVTPNLNSSPPSVDWMVLALKGANGTGITDQAVGFTMTGGTTPKTLTVALDANVSGTNTGDNTLGAGVATFLATPTLANLNSAVSDADVAILGANVFTGQQTFKEVKDTVYTITDGAAFEIDPVNGSVQVVTLGASRSPLATNFEAGQMVLLGIDDGTAYAVTWPSVTWVKSGGTGAAPTLATSGYTWVLLFKQNTTLFGAIVGSP